MQTAGRRRRNITIAVSAVAHAGLLALVALQSPRLVMPRELAGPPEPVIPVLLAPRAPPARVGARRAQPDAIRLHRRALRGASAPLPIPPLPEPEELPTPPAAPPPRPASDFHPAPLPESPRSDLRAALRSGPTGCANPDAVGLTKAERQVCEQRLGGLARITPYKGLGLSAAKQADFDRAASAKEAAVRARNAPVPAGNIPGAGGAGQSWQVRP